ncbi:MAG TPA: type IV toxin-antitoxin system AbiEi family antitoxin domain-containing protein [Chloroflexota bacterium]|nr:type IV toxin-antitoxin system AbiEi family antitoxin domain-containing protein [Chloroflexota bacterium]
MGRGRWTVRGQALGRLRGLGEQQAGLFTRAQAVAAGVSDDMLVRYHAARRIRRVAWGVYRLGGDQHCYERVRAAWLSLNGPCPRWPGVGEWPAAVVSHLAGAAMFDLCPEPHQLTFTVPISRRTRRHDVRFVTAPLAPGEWTWWEGMAVARPPRIAVDLLAEHRHIGEVARLVERALQRGLTSPVEMGNALASVDHLLGQLLDQGCEASFLRQLARCGNDPCDSATSPVGMLSCEHDMRGGGRGRPGGYPPEWPQLAAAVRQRSQGRCECVGQCGNHLGHRCPERHRQPARTFRGRVYLAAAHLNWEPHDRRLEVLRALCQCHLRYDRPQHRRTAATRREQQLRAANHPRLFE